MAKSPLRIALLASMLLASSSLARAEGRLDPAAADVVAPVTDSQSILATEPQAVEKASVASGSGLIPFEQASDSFLLSGEDDTSTFSFNVSAAQVAAGGVVQIGYQNAVSVLPDTSVVDVELNGKPLGQFPIVSPNGVSLESVPVSADKLMEGRNTVVLRARQSHRVDCSMEATYELWTRIDAVKSGFVSTVPTRFQTTADLLSVQKTNTGLTDLRVIVPATANQDMINALAPVVQTIALYLHRDDILVTLADKPGTGPGLDLYVGADSMGEQNAKGMEALKAAPYGLSVADSHEAGRAAVVLRGGTPQDLSAALLTAVRGELAEGFKTGTFAGRFGTVVAKADQTFTLADAGYRTHPFAGRLSRTHFNLSMPADFYPAEYATLDLNLQAATSPGLNADSQLLVRVNDRIVSSYPFRNQEGETFTGKRIELPLRAFKPGDNKVEILAEVARPSDAACLSGERDDSKPRFLLLENTTLTVPKLARIGRLPDLAAFSGKAYPFRDGKPFDLYIERPDAQTMSSALTVLARLSLAAGNPLGAKIKLSAPDPTAEGNALVFATKKSFANIGKTEKGAFPVSGFNVDDSASAFAVIDPQATGAIVVPQEAIDSDNPEALLQAFQQNTADQQGPVSLTSKARDLLRAAGSRFGNWLNYQDDDTAALNIKPENALLQVAQTRAPAGEGTWTTITAQSPRELALGVRRLVEPAVWTALDGGNSVIETTSLTLVNHAPARRYIAEVTDNSFGNYRRLAAAWFSDYFQVYVLLILALMGTFGAWLGLVAKNSGVRIEK